MADLVHDFSKLINVIERLENAPAILREEALAISADHQKETVRKLLEGGMSWSAASGDLPHFNQPDPLGFINSIKNNLDAQVEIFENAVVSWFDHCTHPAPSYTWRITVILRKAKAFEIEKRFLAAYFKHFYTERGSARDRDLGIRAIKIGIDIPAPADAAPLPLKVSDENRAAE